MPITQSRMHRLIIAAQDYRNAFDMLTNILAQQTEMLRTGERTLQQAWDIVAMSSKPILLLGDPQTSGETIIEEALHYKTTHRLNRRKAQKLRENREADANGLARAKRPINAPRQITPNYAKPSPIAQANETMGQTWAERSAASRLHELTGDPTQSLDLMGGDEEPDPLAHSPDDGLDMNGANRAVVAEYTPRPGFTVARALCLKHQPGEGGICSLCGDDLAGGT